MGFSPRSSQEGRAEMVRPLDAASVSGRSTLARGAWKLRTAFVGLSEPLP